jgi:glycopeptide antibiotics resistance protein
MQFYIPPIATTWLVLCFVLVLVCVLAFRHKKFWISVISYALILLIATIFSRTYHETHVIIEPFWSYKAFFENGFTWLTWEILYNIFMMIPLGFLLSYRMKRRFVIPGGVAFSACIELLQFCFHRGTAEVDDILSNSLGVLIGVGMYSALHFARQTRK